jgi:septation ring formation regulator EzrA
MNKAGNKQFNFQQSSPDASRYSEISKEVQTIKERLLDLEVDREQSELRELIGNVLDMFDLIEEDLIPDLNEYITSKDQLS